MGLGSRWASALVGFPWKGAEEPQGAARHQAVGGAAAPASLERMSPLPRLCIPGTLVDPRQDSQVGEKVALSHVCLGLAQGQVSSKEQTKACPDS